MARRLYLGSLPERVNEAALAEHLCMALKAVGGATTDRPVWHLYVNEGRKFGFAEFMTVEECSNTVALDGILFNGASIRIRRPNDYVPSEAQRMGPSMPSKALRVEVVGLQAGGFTRPEDDPDRIFVGGLPYDLLEGQFIDLLTSAGGPLRSHTYKKNPDTGLGAGYGFAVFVDPSSADAAITSLHGLRMGDKCLTCRRAGQGQRERQQQQQQQQQQFFSAPPPQIQQPIPTAVVRLNGCVTASELSDPNEYKEIYDDMLEEAERYGNVLKLHIPKPEGEASVPGLGKVYVRYADPSQSLRAFQAMNGRKFGGNTVVADFLDERKFDEGTIE